MVKRLLILFIVAFCTCFTASSQTVIFSNPGETYGDTDGRTEDMYGPIDVSNCSSISFSLDFSFSLPWEGSGNMESSDECNFGTGCNPDPNNPLNGDCPLCWDFLYVRLLIDGTEVFTELIGGPGTTDADQMGTIELDGYCIDGESNLEIEVYTQTWASAEEVTFSNIEVQCWDETPIPVIDPNPVCEGENVQLDETSGNFSSWSWTGPNGFTSMILNPIINDVSLADEGIYEVTVQDPNSCPLSATVMLDVIEFPELPSLGPYCELEDPQPLPSPIDGVSGNWSGTGVSGNTFDPSVGPGNYTLTFTESTGNCSGTITVTVEAEEIITPPALGPYCETEDPINLPVPVSGINGNWSGTGVMGNQFDPNIPGPGVTTLTFTPEPSACSEEITVDVTIEMEMEVSLSIQTTFCQSDDPYTLNTTQSGITGTWSGPGVMSNVFDPSVPPGSPVTLTFTPDAGQCAAVSTIEVTITTGDPVILDPIGPLCEGGSSVTLPVTQDGIPGSWEDAGGNPISDFDPVNSGTFTIIFIPDAGECALETELTIVVENKPTGTPQTITECGAGTFAVFDLEAVENDINSTPGALFTWYEDMALTMEITNTSNFPSGSTTIYVVIEINGCVSDPIAIELIATQPPSLTPLSDIVICEGELLELIGQEVAGADYEWTGPNGYTSTDRIAFVSLNATPDMSGTYTFTVTVGDCDPVSESLEVVVNPEPDIVIDADTLSICDGGEAMLEVTNSNPQLLINFDWNESQFDGLNPITINSSGTYSVTVTDENGCTSSASTTINFPDPIAINCSQLQGESGPGAGDGEANINISGGTEPYLTIDWTGPTSGTENNPIAGDNTISNLEAGTYTFTVTDDNGCTATCQVVITSANCPLTIEIEILDSLQCFDDSTASLTVNSDNVTGNLAYQWSTTENTQQIDNLPAGTYTVTVTDDAVTNCSAIQSITITQPDELMISCSEIQGVSGPGAADGEANVNIAGGTEPYVTIEWSGPTNGTESNPVAGDNTISNLENGTYTFTVTDNNGCTNVCFTDISSVGCPLDSDISLGDMILCYDDSTASITAEASNFTGPLTYEWSTGETTQMIENLPAGDYTVTITDEGVTNCADTTTITITQPDQILIECEVTQQISGDGNDDAIIEVTFSGGSAPFDIFWAGPESGSAAGISSPYEISPLPSGTYMITITDANGCTATCESTVSPFDCNLTGDIEQLEQIICNGDSTASIVVFPISGTSPYEYNWSHDPGINNDTVTGIPAGDYFVTITDDQNCTAELNITITEPDAIELICASPSDGELTYEISGGSIPYDVDISGPQSISFMDVSPGSYTETNLSGGTYNIIVTDQNGCTATCSQEVVQSSDCNFSLSINILDSISCTGNSDGAIQLNIIPGGGGYDLTWEDNSSSYNRTDLEAGTYSVTVSDGTCIDSVSVILPDPPEYEIGIEGDSILCEGRSLTLGIDGNYSSLEWQPDGQNSPDIEVTEPGTYSLVAENRNGCRDTASIEIIQLDTLLSYVRDTICSQDTIFVNGTAYSIGNSEGIEVFPGDGETFCDSTVIVDLFSRPGGFMYEVIQPDCSGPFITEVNLVPDGRVNSPYDIYVNGAFLETAQELPYTISLSNEGEQLINVVDATGCEFSREVMIERIEPIVVSISGDVSIIAGDTATLEAIVSTDYESLFWIPPFLVSCDTCRITDAFPSEDQTFTVTVINSDSCRAEASLNLEIEDGKTIYIPTAFSPNLDGINDTYRIYTGPGARGVREFMIFDRWGNRLYSENYPTAQSRINGWNGRYHGKFMQPGVFIVVATVEYLDGTIERINKDFTLIR